MKEFYFRNLIEKPLILRISFQGLPNKKQPIHFSGELLGIFSGPELSHDIWTVIGFGFNILREQILSLQKLVIIAPPLTVQQVRE